MADLAASLLLLASSFGEKIQPRADLASTRRWIADSVRELSDRISASGLSLVRDSWRFCQRAATAEILQESHSLKIGVVWDPANRLLKLASDQRMERNGWACVFGTHLKDLSKLVMAGHLYTGDGEFPLLEVGLQWDK